jgi:hypothetical protein
MAVVGQPRRAGPRSPLAGARSALRPGAYLPLPQTDFGVDYPSDAPSGAGRLLELAGAYGLHAVAPGTAVRRGSAAPLAAPLRFRLSDTVADSSRRFGALGLRKAPDHSTLHRFMRRLDEKTLLAALNENVHRMAASNHTRRESPTTAAVGATGLAPGTISTFYVRRTHNRGGNPMLWCRWLKRLTVVDTQRQVVLAQETCSGPYNRSAMLRTKLLRSAWSWLTRSSTVSRTTATCVSGLRYRV